jgi:hypothetical protein
MLQATVEDYERVPIDLIGEALLRGMGWKKGEAIGGKNKAYDNDVCAIFSLKHGQSHGPH